MRHIPIAALLVAILATASLAQDNGRDGDDPRSQRPKKAQQPAPQSAQQPAAQPVQSPQPAQRPESSQRPQSQQRAPLVIHMGHPQQQVQPSPRAVDPGPKARTQRPAAQPRAQQQPYTPPSYGRIQWDASPTAPQARTPRQRPSVKSLNSSHAADPDFTAAHAVSHHPYSQGYVRLKLQKMGVKSEPGYITDRSEMVISDRKHSVVPRPDRGWDNEVLRANPIQPRRFNSEVVRNQMSHVGRPEYMNRLQLANREESERGRYYWHRDDGFRYGHYVDNTGYNWYGWYVGDQYFWTRNYAGRWWWYDQGYGRWCFWNDNFWWWQDPNHVGDLYCYNNDTYVPVNSADDPIVVTSTDHPDSAEFASPDGTRIVKIASSSKDAFLYDAANPPTFEPQYLASGVESVEFSDSRNGSPLEIILKLDDGTYDMLDADGDPYVPATTRSISE
jgi:hypothetical protein